MSDLVEIRWHGRGGQGAKTAALLLADVAFSTGRNVQGFPEYGPERMGAPITAFNRVSSAPIRIHANIYQPDYVVVIDDSLLESVDVTKGLKAGGAIIINTTRPRALLAETLAGFPGRVHTIDARAISRQALGRYMPNTPMLAAVVKVSGLMPEGPFFEEMERSFRHKFAHKPEVVQKNMDALRQAWQEVQ